MPLLRAAPVRAAQILNDVIRQRNEYAKAFVCRELFVNQHVKGAILQCARIGDPFLAYFQIGRKKSGIPDGNCLGVKNVNSVLAPDLVDTN